MAFEITRADVWAGEIEDRPGGLADKLEPVMRVGANLDFVIARPADKPGNAVVFITSLQGAEQTSAAEEAGLKKSSGAQSLRIEGPDSPGLTAGIARTLAEANISIRGLSGARMQDKALFYLRFDSQDDAEKAARTLAAKLS